MNKGTKYYGIDISKDVFDVTDSNKGYFEFENNYKDFKVVGSMLCVVV